MADRTDTIIRALWEATDCGKHTIRKYRVADLTGQTLTPEDDAALLATGIVREIPGMGGPSSYAFTVTPDDLHAYSVGEFWAPEIEDAAVILTAGDEFPDIDPACASIVRLCFTPFTQSHRSKGEDMNDRFTIEDYDDAEGIHPWCVVDNCQTGSDGGPLIVGRYLAHSFAELVQAACVTLVGRHAVDCDMDDDCTCHADRATESDITIYGAGSQ